LPGLQHKGVYYVNSAVDASNYCSLKYLVPFGLYDLDRIDGEIRYCKASDGVYTNIGGHQVSTGGKPFLTDKNGVFGNPASDSRRTAVSLATENLLSVVFAGSGTGFGELYGILKFAGDILTRYNKGTVQEVQVVGA
jgi:DNA/RNA-binding domain of Phe-tRNA-synthetase-like protein